MKPSRLPLCVKSGPPLTGKAPGRSAPGEITLFKSLGLAVEDLWSAAHVYRRAREKGAGARVAYS